MASETCQRQTVTC